MTKQNYEPGPGRSTSEAAFNELKKEIADRNERAHTEARVLRTANDRQQILTHRRQEDSLD
jgi:hypothetical protein